MSLTLVPNNLGLQFGFNGTGESGINVSTFRLEVTPEIDEYLPGIDGQAICNAVGDPQGDLTIEGEFKSSAGPVAAVFTTAFSPSNSTTYFGRSQGGLYLKSGSAELDRSGWKKITTNFKSRWNIA
jgi:hypothetical protein